MSNIEGERIMGELERMNEDERDDVEHKSFGERMMAATADVPAGESTLVDDIKAKTAQLIDIAEGLKENDPRASALAVQYYEIAEMFAVKAALT